MFTFPFNTNMLYLASISNKKLFVKKYLPLNNCSIGAQNTQLTIVLISLLCALTGFILSERSRLLSLDSSSRWKECFCYYNLLVRPYVHGLDSHFFSLIER